MPSHTTYLMLTTPVQLYNDICIEACLLKLFKAMHVLQHSMAKNLENVNGVSKRAQIGDLNTRTPPRGLKSDFSFEDHLHAHTHPFSLFFHFLLKSSRHTSIINFIEFPTQIIHTKLATRS